MDNNNERILDERWRTNLSVFLALDSFVTLFTIAGNGIFMATLLLDRSLHTPPNVMLGALCLSDLLVGVVVQPLYIACITSEFLGEISDDFIVVKTTITWFCIGLSFQHIFLISLDRYAAICHPFEYHAHATCWLHFRISILTTLLPLSVAALTTTLLVFGYHNTRNYVLASVLLMSVLAVVFYNWKVFSTLRRQRKRIVAVGESIEEVVGERKRQFLKRKKERNKAYVIAVVLLLFFICYTPLFVQFAFRLSRNENILESLEFKIFEIWADFFLLLNSMVNPIIYYARMKEIRKAASSILCRRLHRDVNDQLSVSNGS